MKTNRAMKAKLLFALFIFGNRNGLHLRSARYFFLVHTYTSLGRAQIAGLEFSFFTPIDRVH